MKKFKMYKLDTATKFLCSRCNKNKTSKNIAKNGDTLLCNGCFGLALSRNEINKE